MFHPFKNICDYPRNVDCETIKGLFPFTLMTTEQRNSRFHFKKVNLLILLILIGAFEQGRREVSKALGQNRKTRPSVSGAPLAKHPCLDVIRLVIQFLSIFPFPRGGAQGGSDLIIPDHPINIPSIALR